MRSRTASDRLPSPRRFSSRSNRPSSDFSMARLTRSMSPSITISTNFLQPPAPGPLAAQRRAGGDTWAGWGRERAAIIPAESTMATFVQDVWLGSEPRLRARRFAPYEEAAVRVIFHPDLGETLDDAPLAGFLEVLATRVEVIAYEPRGQGGSAGRFGLEGDDDHR